MVRYFPFLLLNFLLSSLYGQQVIFAELESEKLLNAVVTEYKPNYVELFTDARNLMFTKIYNKENYVSSIYSGYKLFLPPNEQYPIQYLAMEGRDEGINAEHIYPRSKGASAENGNAFSDLYNLAPIKWDINEARAEFPFGEIHEPNAKVFNSYYETVASTSTDDTFVKGSKLMIYNQQQGLFEPMDRMKGDVARSVFYFYTMYREEALKADPNYFQSMQSTLCKWHQQDPVDQEEMEINIKKSQFQSNKQNPFIADCSLANRLYCSENTSPCQQYQGEVAQTSIVKESFQPSISVFPNPSGGKFMLDISSINPGNYRLEIFDAQGANVYSLKEQLDYFNTINLWNVRDGVYFLHLYDEDNHQKYSTNISIKR